MRVGLTSSLTKNAWSLTTQARARQLCSAAAASKP